MTWTEIMTIEENDEALVVEIYAQQFNWKARYAGEDGVLGDANVRFLQDFGGKNLVGIDSTDPNGDDEGVESEELTRYVQFLYLISTLTLRYFKYCTQLKLYMKKITN